MDALMKEVTATMYKQKKEKLLLRTIPGDLFKALFENVNPDPNRKARFSRAIFRKEKFKRRGNSEGN